MPRPKPDLDALRAQIAALEKRPVLADGAALAMQRQGGTTTQHANEDWSSTGVDLLSVPAGILHEIFTDEHRQSSTALGFALGLARNLISDERHALLYLQLAAEAQELGLPYGIGLTRFGFDSANFIIGRMETSAELLWAMEEAIACRAVAGVIADFANNPKVLDFTVSRRISLRTAASGTSAFLLRYGKQREASAAKLRWRVTTTLSEKQELDPLAPGPPRFSVNIEKRRLGDASQRAEGTRLIVDWTEDGFVSVEPRKWIRTQPRRTTAVPRTFITALGDRLSEAS